MATRGRPAGSGKPITIEGVTYANIGLAAKAIGVSRQTMYHRLNDMITSVTAPKYGYRNGKRCSTNKGI